MAFIELRANESRGGRRRGRLADTTVSTMALRTEAGRVQLVTVTYNGKGKSTVTEQSGWMTYEEDLNTLK